MMRPSPALLRPRSLAFRRDGAGYALESELNMAGIGHVKYFYHALPNTHRFPDRSAEASFFLYGHFLTRPDRKPDGRLKEMANIRVT